MNINFKKTLRGLAAVSALAAIALPVAAQAQTEDEIQGTIAAVTGQYSLQVNDSRGYVDNVGLGDGTTRSSQTRSIRRTTPTAPRP